MPQQLEKLNLQYAEWKENDGSEDERLTLRVGGIKGENNVNLNNMVHQSE